MPAARSEENVLPATQATYLPDRHLFALWTWTGHDAGAAPTGIGDPEKLTLALPVGERGAIEPVEVATAVVTPTELADVILDDLAPSALAWRALLTDEQPAELPAAAHAVPDAVGTAIVSAERAARVLCETQALDEELAGVLDATLRPYQVRGVGWLRETVSAYGGAVLADEMGLGKTVQTIGFLQGRADGPQLVVCPTSLVGNWVHEIERFAPGLKPVPWRGGTVQIGRAHV